MGTLERLRRAATEAMSGTEANAEAGTAPNDAAGGTEANAPAGKPDFIDDTKQKILDALHKLPLPMWAIIAIGIVAVLLILCICFCICKKCCCKKRKDKKGIKGGVDLKSVGLLGGSYKEKVQPDLEELEVNMEDNEGDNRVKDR